MSILIGMLSIAAVMITGKVTYQDMFRGAAPQHKPEVVCTDEC